MRTFPNFFQRVVGKRVAPKPRKPLSKPGGAKNGFLIMGVIATLFVMVALTIFNIRLLREQVPMRSLPIRDALPEQTFSVIPERANCDTDQEEKKHSPPTEMTFYKQLKTQEEKGNPETAGRRVRPANVENGTSEKVLTCPNQNLTQDGPGFSFPALSGTLKPVLPESAAVSPEKSQGQKLYSVQVGVFSHPRIAKEWAEKWKSKGYQANLRPIARPSSGVQYRLFLGEFNSEKDAEEFAMRLKAKEGVTGMTLAVKD